MLVYFTALDPLNCIIGLQNISKLRNMWEHRPPPVVYTSPYIMIPLNCNGIGTVTRILAGGYEVIHGVNETSPIIVNSQLLCNLSSQPVDVNINVYECILDNPFPAFINSLQIYQRNSQILIVSIHDGQTDITLISIDISK